MQRKFGARHTSPRRMLSSHLLSAIGAVSLSLLSPIQSAHAAHAESVLYSFCAQSSCSDGAGPISDLIADSSGNLYGTANTGGGDCSCGVVFKVTPEGAETVLHTFTGQDGAYPVGALLMDASGNLYGAAEGGVNGYGEVFKIGTDGSQRVLYSFSGGKDGA